MTAMAIFYLLMYRYCQFIQPFRYDLTRQTPTRSDNPAMCYNMHAFSRQILETFDVIRLPSPTSDCCEVINCQQQSEFFLAHRVYRHYRGLVQKLFSRHTDRP